LSPPVGPTGLPEQCDGDGPPTWQVTAAVDAMATTIVFDQHVELRETAATATLGRFSTARFGWSITAGGVIDGSIDGRALHGGATLAGAASWLPIYERARRPFVSLSASAGTAWIRATADDGNRHTWSAWDVRVGAMTGKTFAGVVTPYVAVRLFGGPVFWQRGGASVTGGDRYHVTAGLGVTVRLPARLALSVEAMPLGERSLTGAVTSRF
jgi:hypothetical protein